MASAARILGQVPQFRGRDVRFIPMVAAPPPFAGRPNTVLLLSMLAIFVIPAASWGGMYNPCEPDEGPFIIDWVRGGSGFKITLLRYRSLGAGDKDLEFDNPMRRRYQLVERLSRGKTDNLTMLEKLSLSEYLIRRGDAENARQLLKPLEREAEASPISFLFYCNMATACQQIAESSKDRQASEYYESKLYMDKALKKWPEKWEALDPAAQKMLFNLKWEHESPASTFYRCRAAEVYFLKLLDSRRDELFRLRAMENEIKSARDEAERTKLAKALKEKRKAMIVDNDKLFTKGDRSIRYVDEQGEFAPGKLAADERALLPDGDVDRAIAIVQQLLIWLPRDLRIYRQLGELYNARGKPRDIAAARDIFNDLVVTMQLTQNDDLRRRNSALGDFPIPPEPPPADDLGEDSTQHLQQEKEGLMKENADLRRQLDDKRSFKIDENAPVNWRTISVTFIFGAAVGLVGLWQVQEILRRFRRNKV